MFPLKFKKIYTAKTNMNLSWRATKYSRYLNISTQSKRTRTVHHARVFFGGMIKLSQPYLIKVDSQKVTAVVLKLSRYKRPDSRCQTIHSSVRHRVNFCALFLFHLTHAADGVRRDQLSDNGSRLYIDNRKWDQQRRPPFWAHYWRNGDG